jgi:hypothetical protein
LLTLRPRPSIRVNRPKSHAVIRGLTALMILGSAAGVLNDGPRLSLLQASAQAVPPQSAPDAWGDPVDGVQLKLAVSKNKPPRLPGELPALEVQLWNQGPRPVTFGAEAIAYPHIEIDGVWYVQTWAGSCCSGARDIGPGAQSDVLAVYIDQTNLSELNASPARMLDLRPGAPARALPP